jgi:hypothetical protein
MFAGRGLNQMVLSRIQQLTIAQTQSAVTIALWIAADRYHRRHECPDLDSISYSLIRRNRSTDELIVDFPAADGALECLSHFAREMRGYFDSKDEAIAALWGELADGCDAEIEVRRRRGPK